MIHPDTHTVYLAGPMTGYPDFNFAAFDDARARLRRDGYAVICPAELDREAGFDPERDEWTPTHSAAAARRDLKAIANVDAVAVLRGFTKSSGARVELAAARWIGLPVVAASDPRVELTNGVDQWLAGRLSAEVLGHEQGARSAAAILERTDEAQRGYAGAVYRDPMHDDDPAPLVDALDPLRRAEQVAALEADVVGEALRIVGLEPDDDRSDRPPADEVRVVDADTGGEKGAKLARFDLIPAGPLWQVAEHYGLGARKYAARNWERGYAWSLSYGALCRHLLAWWNGENHDPELGDHHLAAVAFHALALLEFTDTHPEKDDRPR